MKISKKGEYALRAMLYLSLNYEGDSRNSQKRKDPRKVSWANLA